MRWLHSNTVLQSAECDAVSQDDRKPPHLRLYQYHTCPFCCKARAFLDYYGYDYEIVEVNPLFKKETKFSPNYRKVPILLIDDAQVNDSSVIVSVLRSQAVQPGKSVDELLRYYPAVESKNEKGKPVTEFQNRYRVMYGEDVPKETREQIIEESKWRKWVDDRYVHMMSPNIYRTMGEAFQAFEYISRVGNFSRMETVLAQYVGAVAMYFVGKSIKKKHDLKEDVRQSLYDETHVWLKAIGKKRPFLGGDEPNLADLNVYGVISAIDGLDAFNDLMANTNIAPWYDRMKARVTSHDGAAIHDKPYAHLDS